MSGTQINRIGMLMAGFLEKYRMGAVAFSAGVMKTMLPQMKPTNQIRIANPTALTGFCGIGRLSISLRHSHVEV